MIVDAPLSGVDLPVLGAYSRNRNGQMFKLNAPGQRKLRALCEGGQAIEAPLMARKQLPCLQIWMPGQEVYDLCPDTRFNSSGYF